MEQRRRQAVEQLVSLEVEDYSESEALCHEVQKVHGPGGLHRD